MRLKSGPFRRWRPGALPVSAPSRFRFFAAPDWYWRRRDSKKCDRPVRAGRRSFPERHDGVFESRRLRIRSDRLDLLQLLGHALLVGGRKVLVLDLVERRVMEIEGAFLQERIFSHACGTRRERRRLFRGRVFAVNIIVRLRCYWPRGLRCCYLHRLFDRKRSDWNFAVELFKGRRAYHQTAV